MKKLYILFFTLSFSFFTIYSQAQYKILHDFNKTNGEYPHCTLTQVGNIMYGTTQSGGALNFGCVFSISMDGSNFKDIHDFNYSDGANSESSLVYTSGVLYGVELNGGIYGSGVVYSVDTNGSNFKVLHNFIGTDGNAPWGALTLSGKVLYGTSVTGGANSYGTIFSIDTDGTAFKTLFNFDSIHGAGPECQLTLAGGMLYGMTQGGGVDDIGCIFKIDTNGTGLKNILNFDTINGFSPIGSLIISGSTLFGMTQAGGTSNFFGNIFSIDTDGTRFKNLFYFNDTNGQTPYSNLTLSGDTLYGMTLNGGRYYHGSVFSIDTNGSGFENLYNFDTIYGAGPYGALTLSGGFLYGTTYSGSGIHSNGSIFRLKPCLNNFNEPICIVTIDTATNKCKVIWGRTNSPPDSGSYNIYRSEGSNYNLMHSQPLDSLSEYLDMSSHPDVQPENYKISTVDSCVESSLSAPHTTIFLMTLADTNVYILNWTPYIGFTPSKYRIFRGPTQSSMVQIDSVPNSVNYYVDTLPPLGSVYAVEAVNPFFTCVATHKALSHRLHGPSLSGSFSNGFNTAILGINTIKATITNFKTYPNPNNGIFTLSYSMNAASSIRMSIMDELGQVVYDNTEQKGAGNFNEHLNLEKFAPGIYSLRFQTNADITISKLAIVH